MERYQELIEFPGEGQVKVFLHKMQYVSAHWHSCVEVLFVVQGSVRVTVENKVHDLETEDVIIINANQLHELYSEDCVLAAVQFEPAQFYQIAGEQGPVAFHCNSAGHAGEQRFVPIKRLVAELVYVATHYPEQLPLVQYSLACKLVQDLLAHFRASGEAVAVRSKKYQQRLTNIIGYINDHYTEGCSLTDIAAHEHLTPSYLSSFFEKNMGQNLSAYITKVRLGHAVHSLLNSDLTIEEIAYQNGFPNPRAFVTGFRKEYDQLPSHYRKLYQDRQPPGRRADPTAGYQVLEYNDSLAALVKYLQPSETEILLEQRGATRMATLQVNAAAQGEPLRHTWKVFTSVGSAREIMYAETQAMLAELQKNMGFEYIKFHGIFDDSLMVYDEDTEGNPKYVFTNVDKVLDFLLSIGLRPLVQFSFMPRALAAPDRRKLFYAPGSSYIALPKALEKWAGLIRAFLRHAINRYGYKEVESWLFTVWNEPDSPQRLFGLPMDGFDEMYEATHRATKALLPAAQFGSPSFMQLYDTGYFNHFMQFCATHSCLPDFYIIHFYPIVGDINAAPLLTLHEPISLSTDPNYFQKYITRVRALLPQNRGEKVYLTEWNSTTSHRDLLNDTCYKAAYVVKCICENYDDLDSFGYWCLSDGIEELRIEQELFHGGLGLYTMNGIKKPAWYAFCFLAQLGDELVDRGEGYFITRGRGGWQILLYNYHHFNDIYAHGVLFDVTPDNRYAAFVENEPMEFELVLQNLADGPYAMTEHIVNRSHGSCYDTWHRMGAQPLDTEAEVEALRALSTPDLQKRTTQAEEGRLHYYAMLEPHEIRLVTIRQKY